MGVSLYGADIGYGLCAGNLAVFLRLECTCCHTDLRDIAVCDCSRDIAKNRIMAEKVAHRCHAPTDLKRDLGGSSVATIV